MSKSQKIIVDRKRRLARSRLGVLSFSAVASMYASSVSRGQIVNTPLVGVTGWNQDLIAEHPLSNSTTEGFDTVNGQDYFVNGLFANNIASGAYGAGVPTNGFLNSATGVSAFQFQPYTAYNALFLSPLKVGVGNASGIAPSVATLNYAVPATTSSLSFLMSSTNGTQSINFDLDYSDGTVASGSFSAPDWFNNTPFAAAGLGRTNNRIINSTQGITIDTGQSNSSSGNPRLYEYDVPTALLATNSSKYLTGITFSSPNTNTHETAIYAVSGATGSTLAANPLTFTGNYGANVDTISSNFTNASGNPTVFSNGTGPLIFDDTANSNNVDSNNNVTLTIQAAGISPVGVIFNNSNITYTVTGGPVFGPGGLIVDGANSGIYLNNVNHYLGTTNVSNGATILLNGTIVSPSIIVGPGSYLTVLPGGTLGGVYNSSLGTVLNPGLLDSGEVDLASAPQTIAYLNGSGLLNLSGGATVTIGSQLGLSTFSGTIAGVGNLQFRGPLTLSGASSFVGNSSFGVSAAVLLGNQLALGALGNTFQISGGIVGAYSISQQMGGIGASTPLVGVNAVPYNYSFGGTNLFGFSGLYPLELKGNATNWNTGNIVYNLISIPSAALTLSGQIGVGGGGLIVTGGGTMILNNSSGTNALSGTLAVGPSTVNGVSVSGISNSAALQLNGAKELGSINAIGVSYSGAGTGSSLIINDNSGLSGYVGGVASAGAITVTINGLGAPLALPNPVTGVTVPLGFGALRGADNVASIWAGNVSVGSATAISGGNNGSLNLTGIISGSNQIQFSLNTNSVTTLSAVNTYTGETALNGSGGTLKLGANNAIALSSDLNLDLNPAGTSQTTFDLAGYSTVIGYLATTSALPATAGDKITNSGSTLSTLTLNGSGGTFSGSIQETATGPISLFLNISGTQAFNAASNFSAGTTMNGAGSLLLGNSAALGSGVLNLKNGYLGSSNASGITVSNTINYNAATGIQLNVTNPIRLVTPISIPAGTLLPFKTVGTDPNGDNGVFAGVISGFGGVNIIGTVAFNAFNTYTGATNLSAGSSLAIPGDTGYIGTGPINYLGGALTFENYTSYLNFSNASGSNIPVTLGAASGAPSTLAGNISGGAGFTFVGPGTLILSGSNTYTGPTVITGGSLLFSSGVFPVGPYTFNGGTLFYPTGNTTDFTSGGYSLSVGSGGVKIDTNGNNVTFAGTINTNSSTGTITKQGIGSLSVSTPITASNFYVQGGTSAAPSVFNLNSTTGTLTVSGTVGIGEASGDNAIINLNNGAKLTAGTLNVGDAVATGAALPLNNGTLNIADTTAAGTVVTASTVNIGYANGGTNAVGIINQTGGLFKSTSTLNLGVNGTGVYNISGGVSNVSSMYVSTAATGSGIYNQLGGITNETSTLELGEYNKGTLNVAAGTFNLSSTGYIGYYTTGGNGVINITGGTFNAGGGNTIYYGYENPAVLNLTGGAFTTNDTIYAGYYTGTALFNQTGGSFYSSTGFYLSYDASTTNATYNVSNSTAVIANLYIGYIDSGSATGTFNLLSGGTLLTSSVSTNGTTGIGAYLNLNGGTLKANASSTTFVTTTVTTSIGALGGTINTNGFAVTIPGNISSGVTGSADGGLTKTGPGTLTLSGINTFSGPLNVNGGFLIVPNAAATGSGVINLNGGALTIPNDAFYNTLLTTKTINLNGGGLQLNNYSSTAINISTPNAFQLGATTTGTSSFSGSIAAASLNYVGPGILALTGNNTLPGGTTLAAGTLLINSDTAVGNITFAGGAVGFLNYTSNLSFNNSSAFPTGLGANAGSGSILTGVIAGTAPVNYTGPGSLTLTGANTYTGGTNITAGTLAFAASSLPTGPVNLLGGTFQYSAGSSTDLTTAGRTLTLGTGGGAIDTNGNNVTFGGNISGTNLGAFTKTGIGSLTIAGSLTPTSTTVQGGTSGSPSLLSFNGSNASYYSTGAFTVGKVSGDNAVLDITNGAKVTIGTVSLASVAGSVGTLNLSGGSLLASSIAGGSGASVLNFNGGTLISNSSSTSFVSGLTSLNILTGGATINTNGFNDSIGLMITGSAGDGGLTKTGLGTLTLNSNTSNYTGATNILAGGVIAFGTHPFGATGDVVNVASGATLTQGSDLATTYTINFGGNTSSYTFANYNSSMNIVTPPNVTLGALTGTPSALSGTISGSGSVTYVGPGTLILTNAGNSYSGGTVLSAGSLVITSDAAIGSGPITFAGGALGFYGYSSSLSLSNASGSSISPMLAALTGTTSTFLGTISGGTGLTYVGPGTLILAGTNSYSGATNVTGGLLSFASGTPVLPLLLNGGGYQYSSGSTTDFTTGGRTLVVTASGGKIDTNGNNVTFAGTINSSTGTFNKLGAGTLSISKPLTASTFNVSGGASGSPSGFALSSTTGTLTVTGTVGIGEVASDNAVISLNNGALLTAGTLNVGDGTSSNGTLNIADAGLLGTNVSSGTANIGNGTGSLGVVNLTSGIFRSTSTLNLGVNGTGLFNISGGTSSLSSVNLGTATTGIGAYNQSGGLTTASSSLELGSGGGKGFVNVTGGAFNASSVYLGYGTNGSGVINLSNGVFSATSSVYTGYSTTGSGTINVTGGLFNSSSSLIIGYQSPGTLNLSGGAVNSTSTVYDGYLYSVGIVNQTGGNFTTTGSMYLNYDAQYATNRGVYNLSGGTATIAGTLYISYASNTSSMGLFNVGNGTTLQVGSISTNGTTGVNAKVAINGGTIKANSSSTTFITTTVSTAIGALGATFNTNGFNDTIPAVISTGVSSGLDGGLTKTGIGILTLSGVNTYTGATNINLGGINAQGTRPFGASGDVVNINTGGSVALFNDSNAAAFVTGGPGALPYTFNFLGGGYTFMNYNSSLTIASPFTIGANTGNASTFLGNLTGSGIITFSGPGSLILPAAGQPNFTGTINIVGGNLVPLGDSALNYTAPTFTGNLGFLQINYSTGLVFSNGPVNLSVPTGATGTVTNALSGTAALTFNGPGLLFLPQSGTNSGTTNIGGGVLNFSGTLGTGNINLYGGGTLQYSTGSVSPADLTAGRTFTLAGNGIIDTNGNSVTYTGSIAGSYLGSFTKNNSGGLTIQGSLTPTNATIQGGTAASPSLLAFNGPSASFISNSAGNGFSVGEQTGDYGVLNVSGGASVNVAGGGFNIADQASAVTNSAGVNSDTGIINLSGTGSVITSGGAVAIGKGNGANNGSFGTVNQTGGIFQMSSTTATTTLGVNNFSVGIYNLTGGTALFNTVALTANAGAVAIVNLSGGTFQVNTITAGTGLSTLNFNGGTLRANTSSATFVSGLTNVKVLAGGGTINTNGFSDTITSSITTGTTGTDGGLLKTGLGTLTLTGANTYSGGTTVTGGTLLASTSGGLSTGRLTVNTGGTLMVTNAAAISTAQPITLGGGTLSLASPFSSTITTGFGNFTSFNTNASTSATFVPTNTGTAITLTQSGVGNFAASTYAPITISDAVTYTLSFTYNHSTATGSGSVADGINFGFQNDPRGLLALGAEGGSEAYSSGTGPAPITKSEVGYYDLYNEVYGLGTNGVLTSFGGSTPISSNNNELVTLVYNGPAKTFTTTLNYGTGTYVATATGVDLASILGGTAGGTASGYYGFGGATGGSTATQTIQGFTLSAALPGAVSISSPITLTAGTSSNLQLGSVAGATNSTVGSISFNPGSTLIVTNTATSSSPRITATLTTAGLNFPGSPGAWTGLLDLTNNQLVVQSGNLANLTSQVAQAYASGTWQGSGGITSSAAAADPTHLTGLGVILNSTDGGTTPLYGSGTALGLFDGASPAATDVLVKYTYYGDANLDGKVDGSDYTRIDVGFLSGGALTGWYNGDFNYDGVVDGSDYALIDNSYNTQGAQLTAEVASATAQIAGGSASSAVPEPTTLALLGLTAGSLLGRRRRRI